MSSDLEQLRAERHRLQAILKPNQETYPSNPEVRDRLFEQLIKVEMLIIEAKTDMKRIRRVVYKPKEPTDDA